MKTLAAFTAGVALVVGFALLWSWGTGGRVVALLMVIAAALYGVFRLIVYKPDYSRGAGSLDEMRGSGKLTPLDNDDITAPPAGREGGAKTE